MLQPEDLAQLRPKASLSHSSTHSYDASEQGFPFLDILAAARPGRGTNSAFASKGRGSPSALAPLSCRGSEVTKFVPASGAASRMFKALFEFVDGEADTPAPGSPVAQLVENFTRLPFAAELDATAVKLYGVTAGELIAAGRIKELISALIKPEGDELWRPSRSAEVSQVCRRIAHSARGADDRRRPDNNQFARNGQSSLHCFGQSPQAFRGEDSRGVAGHREAHRSEIQYFALGQKPSTDTVAANPDNTPFREDGKLLFRPEDMERS